MVYHSFHNEKPEWIERAVKEGVTALPADRPLYAGLYLPDLFAFSVGHFDQLIHKFLDAIEAVLPPRGVGGGIWQLERVFPGLLLERVAADLAIAEIELRQLLVLNEVILLPQRHRQNDIGISDVVQVNAIEAG